MGNEFKDFEMETPSLTLEPDLGEFEKKEEILKKWCSIMKSLSKIIQSFPLKMD